MKWPWVSRAEYEREMRSAEYWRGSFVREQTTATGRAQAFTGLLEKYHDLAMRSTPPKADAPALIHQPDDITPRRERSIVAQTIQDEAGGDGRLSRYLTKRASELRAENKTPEEVATELRRWNTTEIEGE